MKAKRVILGFLGIFIVLAFAVNANAAAGFYVCSIDQAGVTGSADVIIFLTHEPSIDPNYATAQWNGSKNFYALQSRAKEMLAVALTALSHGSMYIKVWTDPAQASFNDRILLSMFSYME